MFFAAALASLPDLGEPTVIALGAVLGALVTSTIARARRVERDEIRTWTEDGGYVGALIGLALWVASLIGGLL